MKFTPDGRNEALKKVGKLDYYNGDKALHVVIGNQVNLTFNPRHACIQLAAERARIVSLANANYQPMSPIAPSKAGPRSANFVRGALLQDPTVPFELMETGFAFHPKTEYVHDHVTRHLWPQRWSAMTNPMDTDASCLAGHTVHLLDGEATWTVATCRLAILTGSRRDTNSCDRSVG